MENGTREARYPAFCQWDINQYQPNFPPEHWNLCRLFMLVHKTKYPEVRLVQLTEAFCNIGVHGRGTDPKTDRMVAALSVPVIEHILAFHPGSTSHPFCQRRMQHAKDSGQKNILGSGTKRSEPSTTRDERNHLGQGRPHQLNPESSQQSLYLKENRKDSLDGNKDCRSQLSSHTERDVSRSSDEDRHHLKEQEHKQQPVEKDQNNSNRKRVFSELSAEPDKLYSSESKRRQSTLTLNKGLSHRDSNSVKSEVNFNIIYKMTDRQLKEDLRGFIIIQDISKESTINYDLSTTIEDSFLRSKFGPCSWNTNVIDKRKNRKYIRIRLQYGDKVLIEAEGQEKLETQHKMAEWFITSVIPFSPFIKASYDYYKDGKYQELPQASPQGPCWNFLNRYTYDNLKDIISDFTDKKPFVEMIVLHHGDSPDEFRMQDIIEYIEKHQSGKLKYRLAKFLYKGKCHQAICVYYIHDAKDLLEWVKEHKDKRYKIVSKGTEVAYKTENKQDIASELTNTYQSSGTNQTSSLQPFSRQEELQNNLFPSKEERKGGLSWVGKEHLRVLAKSIYLVKFVKEDSTTEDDPFKLLKTVCSLAFSVEMKYNMKQCEDKMWQVSVLMHYDKGNILVGEARADNCSDARLAAAQDAINTIQACCRVVEPNFKYFAEGGVPSFISRKNPIKTSTYEIMCIDTSKAALTEEVVDLMLNMFLADKTLEEIFFLASDYTREERELIRKMSIKYGLGCRLFGQRNRASTPDDIVSTQHVCLFRQKSAVELVQQLIVFGGSTEKYSIVNKNPTSLPIDESPASAEMPAAREERKICDYESYPGGCIDPECPLAHVDILDAIVNRLLGVR